MIFLGIIHKQKDHPDIIGIGQHGIFVNAFHLSVSLAPLILAS
jgi:hypothetical protein